MPKSTPSSDPINYREKFGKSDLTQPIEAVMAYYDATDNEALRGDFLAHVFHEHELDKLEAALAAGIPDYTEEQLRKLQIWALVSMTQAGFVQLLITGNSIVTDMDGEYPHVRFDTREQDYLKSLPYDEYLRTEHWQEVRREALERAGGACQLCNSPHDLHVHHRTYERRGYEEPEDVIVLCKSCHALFHQIEDGRPQRGVYRERKRNGKRP